MKYDDNVYGYKSKAQVQAIEVMAKHSINKCFYLKEAEPIILDKIKEFDQEYLFNVEINLSKVLGDMELNGLKVA